MKDKKIQKLVDKLSGDYSDVTLFLHDRENGETTMAGHCTTPTFLLGIAIRCILQQAEIEEIDTSVILMSVISSMADNGDLDIEKFKQMCPFFLDAEIAVK